MPKNNVFFTPIKPNLIVIRNVATNTIHTAIQYENDSSEDYNLNLFEIHQLITAGTPGSLALLDSRFDIQNIRIQPLTEQALQQISSLQENYNDIYLSEIHANGSICVTSLMAMPTSHATPTLSHPKR